MRIPVVWPSNAWTVTLPNGAMAKVAQLAGNENEAPTLVPYERGSIGEFVLCRADGTTTLIGVDDLLVWAIDHGYLDQPPGSAVRSR
jgi:hypothetical protein